MVYHGLIGGIATSLVILIEGIIKWEFRIYTWRQYGFLAAAACFDCAACNSMTIAYQRDSSGFVSLLGYAIIIYGFMADLLFFETNIDALQMVGTSIIFVTTFVVAVNKLCVGYKAR